MAALAELSPETRRSNPTHKAKAQPVRAQSTNATGKTATHRSQYVSCAVIELRRVACRRYPDCKTILKDGGFLQIRWFCATLYAANVAFLQKRHFLGGWFRWARRALNMRSRRPPCSTKSFSSLRSCSWVLWVLFQMSSDARLAVPARQGERIPLGCDGR